MHYLSLSNTPVHRQSLYHSQTSKHLDGQQTKKMPSTNSSDDLSVTNSRCIALYDVQVKMITCASRSVFLFNLTCNGPNISSAGCENGGNQAATGILGNWPINWTRGFFRSLR